MLLLYVLGIGASLADHFHCICMPVGIECSACACMHECMVLYIRSRQKASHIMISNIINVKSEETECCLALAESSLFACSYTILDYKLEQYFSLTPNLPAVNNPRSFRICRTVFLPTLLLAFHQTLVRCLVLGSWYCGSTRVAWCISGVTESVPECMSP